MRETRRVGMNGLGAGTREAPHLIKIFQEPSAEDLDPLVTFVPGIKDRNIVIRGVSETNKWIHFDI